MPGFQPVLRTTSEEKQKAEEDKLRAEEQRATNYECESFGARPPQARIFAASIARVLLAATSRARHAEPVDTHAARNKSV